MSNKAMLSLLILFVFSSSAPAQTTEACIANVKQGTRVSSATLGGTVVGGGAGALVCAPFAFVLVDLGASYIACVAATATLGGMVGNAVAHSTTEDEISKCTKLST